MNETTSTSPSATQMSPTTLERSRVDTDPRKRRRLVALGALIVATLAIFLVRVLLGDFTFTITDAVRIVLGEQIDVSGANYVLMESKLPRAVAALVGGALFGAAGAAMQSLVRNPLASPDVLGISLGSSTAAVFCVTLLGWSGWPILFVAVLGGFAVSGVILALAKGQTARMILVGIAMAAGLQSVIQWILLKSNAFQAQDAMVWLAGSVSDVTWPEIARLAGIGLPMLVVLAVFCVTLLGWSGWPILFVAVLGGFAVSGVILALAKGQTARMILVGIAMAAGLQSVIQWILLKSNAFQAQDAMVWLAGSVSDVTWPEIARLAGIGLPMLVVLAVLAHRLRVLELGRPLAVGLGVPDGATRAFVFVGVVLGIAVATSVCGPVAFVALLAGPIARRLMGRTSIVAAALVGASITIAGDYVGAYLIPGGGKLPVGVITGLAGAPVLAWLLVASQRGRSKGTR